MFILVERYSNILLKLFFKSWALIIVLIVHLYPVDKNEKMFKINNKSRNEFLLLNNKD
jgi:hypothetical protein